MNRMAQMCCALGLVVLVASAQAGTVAFSDFQDGTVQGWEQGFANGVSVLNDFGPNGAGDHSLEAVPHPNFRKLFPHTKDNQDFVGNYIANQVAYVTFDAMNPTSSPDTIQLHALVLNGGGNRWASLDNAVVPNDGVWYSYTLSLLESDMINVLGGQAYATDFANVGQFGLRHQEIANQVGGSALSSVNNRIILDNIQLITPEPATLSLLALAGLCVIRRSR